MSGGDASEADASDTDTDAVDGDSSEEDASGTDADLTDGMPVVNADSYETILREIVAIADDRAIDAVSESVDPLFETVRSLSAQGLDTGAASGEGLAFVSVAGDADEGAARTLTFSCGDGGTLVVEALVDDDFEAPVVTALSAGEGCAIGGDVYAGRVAKRIFAPIRVADVQSFESFSVVRANGDSIALDGEYEDSFTGDVPAYSLGWSDTDLVIVEGGETTRIVGYQSRRSSNFFSGAEYSPGATTLTAFSVTAPWSSGARLDVTVNLAFDWDFTASPREDDGQGPILDQQWERGTLRVAATDGSALTLSPETGDAATFSVTIDGDAGGPIVREWSDGFQLSCPSPYVCE